MGLQRSQLDLKRGTLRLQPGRTKNKEGRLVYLPAEALAVLREQERKTRQLERKEQRVIPWVFHYRGERFTFYYKGWYRTCERAGFRKGAFRPHDFRRTASRAYTRAGVSEQIVMKITGHKTRAMFDRYNITAELDLAEAAVRVTNAKIAARKGRAMNHSRNTSSFPKDTGTRWEGRPLLGKTLYGGRVGATGPAAIACINGGTLEHAQQIAAHESPRTIKLYDRTNDQITLDEIERIAI